MQYYFDDIYLGYINLSHRHDRREHLQTELSKFEFISNKPFRLDASYIEGYGAYGCTLSHCRLLSHFLFETNCELLIVLEDDFEVTVDIPTLRNAIGVLSVLRDNLDLAQLTYNDPIGDLQMVGGQIQMLRLYRSFGTSSYLTTREHARTLLKTFSDAEAFLRNFSKRDFQTKHVVRQLSAVDVVWHQLHRSHRYYGYVPSLGRQRPFASDIV